jgi:hypothetical protein
MIKETKEVLVAPQLFRDNDKYRSLDPTARRHVDEGVQQQLWSIEHDYSLTGAGKEQERKYYLETGAVRFLDEIWRLQQELGQGCSKKEGGWRAGRQNGTVER